MSFVHCIRGFLKDTAVSLLGQPLVVLSHTLTLSRISSHTIELAHNVELLTARWFTIIERNRH